MSFYGSSEKPSVCKLRKTTVITFTFLSYLDVTTSTRRPSCLNKSLGFSEWTVHVLQEDRVGIPVLCTWAHTHARTHTFSSPAFGQLVTRFYKPLVLCNVETQRF